MEYSNLTCCMTTPKVLNSTRLETVVSMNLLMIITGKSALQKGARITMINKLLFIFWQYKFVSYGHDPHSSVAVVLLVYRT